MNARSGRRTHFLQASAALCLIALLVTACGEKEEVITLDDLDLRGLQAARGGSLSNAGPVGGLSGAEAVDPPNQALLQQLEASRRSLMAFEPPLFAAASSGTEQGQLLSNTYSELRQLRRALETATWYEQGIDSIFQSIEAAAAMSAVSSSVVPAPSRGAYYRSTADMAAKVRANLVALESMASMTTQPALLALMTAAREDLDRVEPMLKARADTLQSSGPLNSLLENKANTLSDYLRMRGYDLRIDSGPILLSGSSTQALPLLEQASLALNLSKSAIQLSGDIEDEFRRASPQEIQERHTKTVEALAHAEDVLFNMEPQLVYGIADAGVRSAFQANLDDNRSVLGQTKILLAERINWLNSNVQIAPMPEMDLSRMAAELRTLEDFNHRLLEAISQPSISDREARWIQSPVVLILVANSAVRDSHRAEGGGRSFDSPLQVPSAELLRLHQMSLGALESTRSKILEMEPELANHVKDARQLQRLQRLFEETRLSIQSVQTTLNARVQQIESRGGSGY